MAALTSEQTRAFHELGFVCDLPPIFDADEVMQLNAGLERLRELLKPDEQLIHINGWHRTSRWLYDLCTHPKILSYVQGLLGDDFFLWGSHFFAKAPHSLDTVAWHQDAYYWPLSPHNTVTVWLAFNDVDEENGAMLVIPRSQRGGMLKHRDTSSETSVLALELENEIFSSADAVPLLLKAGSISLHDDALIHGSPANRSNRWRTGLTMRFSGTNVKCDLTVNPRFEAFLVHGVDELRLNPQGTVPTTMFARYEAPGRHVRNPVASAVAKG